MTTNRFLAPQYSPTRKGRITSGIFQLGRRTQTRVRPSVQNLEHWDQIESQTIAPHVNRVFQLLTQHFTGRKEEEQIWQSWRDKYVPELVALLKVMRMDAAQKSAKKLSEIERCD